MHRLSPMALATFCALTLPARGQESPTIPSPETKDACVRAYETTQQLRAKGEIHAARARADTCRATCPPTLRKDCDRWADELARAQPYIVVSVRDGRGAIVHGTRLFVDGKPMGQVADNSRVELAAGHHRLRLEHEQAPAVVRRIELREGQTREIVAVLRIREPSVAEGGPPTITYVLGVVGLASLAAAATLSIKGHVDRAELERTCAKDGPFCAQGDVDAIARLWTIGGVLAGVGGAALVSAGTFWALDSGQHPKDNTATSRVFHLSTTIVF